MASARKATRDDQWIINYEKSKLDDPKEYWTARVNTGEVLVGEPAFTRTRTTKELEEMGLIGLYFPQIKTKS
jgi:hypothetical protein